MAPTRAALSEVPLGPLTQALLGFLGDESLKQRWGLRPRNYFPVRPVVDGRFIRSKPLDAIRRRLESDPVRWPVLLGCNAEEMRFYLVPGGAIDRIDEAQLTRFVQDVEEGEALLARHASARGAGEKLCRMQSDFYYRDPAAALARLLHSAGCDTLRYQFDWHSPLHQGRMGAAHAMEIPFVLGNTGSARACEFIGSSAPPRLAREMHDAWAGFARGETLPQWPRGECAVRLFPA